MPNEQQTIAVVISTALTFLNKGKPDEAQDLLVRAKTAAQQNGLEALVNAANRNLAISHLMQAEVHYGTGDLEQATDKYRQADNAFREFDASFGTPEERQILQQWFAKLFPYWADACLKLANNNHGLGNQAITEAAARENNKSEIIKGLKMWDAALNWYKAVIGICGQAAQKQIPVDAGYQTISTDKIKEVSNAAAGWSNAIGEPELASKYLQNLLP
ncbi:hypothetical protein HYU16_00950 [Candidatus Woesearchaeota archaeon]|nr:hypothetical protein [Candidatus Woesearchaeota archaeon]